MKKSERSSYTPIDFLQWSEAGTLVISPKFQRRGVWSRPARSFLIDTLLLGLPVPPIYLRVVQSSDKKAVIREVIDGQQRISSILDYLNGNFSLSKNIESNCAGKRFDELNDNERDAITQYSFICEVFYGVPDSDILKIFARLNTHSVKLNDQELRNGKFFGKFKRLSYRAALDHLEFWRKNKIFSEQTIARMQEVEFTSELIIMSMDGIQDKKKSIDKFYELNDENFTESEKYNERFRSVIDVISDLFPGGIGSTEFRRVPLFYSLYGAIYHRMYKLPKCNISTPGSNKFSKDDTQIMRDAVIFLSDLIQESKSTPNVQNRFGNFVSACLRQTDNIKPRQIRLETIYNTAFM